MDFMKRKTICQAVILMFLATTTTVAQNQHGWRGPNRDGIYPETGLLKDWPAQGPEQLWETLDAGKGYSSPVIVGDRLYITGMNEDETMEILSAYTLDGKKIYSVEYGTPWKASYPEARTTPTIVGDKAYVISGDGEVVCLKAADGSKVWAVDGNTEFGRKAGTWGTAQAPLVFDNKVIFLPGGEQTAVVALEAETGKTVWKSPSLNDISNYASALLIHHNGRKQIVGLTGKSVVGVHPDTGAIEWTFDNWGESATAAGWEKISPNTPLYRDGRIFVCNGYDMDSFMLELNEDATAVKQLWTNKDLDTHVGGFVLLDGIVYGSNWINNGQGNWAAIDWSSGATKYNTAWGGGKSKGSVIAADGMLYCYDERRGTVGLVRPNPEKFDVVSEFRITKGEGPHWAHPVIDGGVLYIRHGSALMAYKLKQ